jgi:D-amino-acid dehydrogenase
MRGDARQHVAVIGAGAVGIISALELLRDGHKVTVIDPGSPGGEQAASYGNAGWLSSHSVIPPAEPGAWKKVPKYLADPLGPLTVRWGYLPKALPWLIRYLRSGSTPAKIEATAMALRALLRDAPLLHQKLADEAGVGELVERQGLLHIYPSRAAFEADSLGWSIRKRVGVEWLELSRDELRQRLPELHPRYTFGVLVEEAGRCRDPGAYVAALAAHARALGADFVSARATGLKLEGGRMKAVASERNDIVCDKAVVAAGARSKPLCAAIGEVLRNHLASIFPNLPQPIPPERIKVWMGHRPSMPDGRPCIGTARASDDVVYAFGHGHIGLVGSARTGRLVAQLVGGRDTEIPVRPFDPRRFL